MVRKNLFLILSDCLGGYGGIAEYNRNVLKALDQNKSYNIYVFVRKGNSNVVLGKNYSQYKPIYNKYLFSLFVIYKAIILRPKIIFNGHIFMLSLSSFILKLTKAKGITQFHGTEIWDKVLTKKQLTELEKFQCLSVSNYTKNNLKIINNLNSKVVPNTYNSQFKNLHDRSKLREKFKIKDSDFVLITVGRLDSRKKGYKGQEDVINFIKEQKKNSNVNFKYFIIGKGELKEHLEKTIKKLDLEKDVFLLGYVNDHNLIKYYNCSDVFVLLSSGEGFGIVYLEAMACGLPAIGLDVGGVPDVLKYPFTKKLVNSTGLKSAIDDLRKFSNTERSNISKKIENDFGFSKFRLCINKQFNQL
jgi:phosphatidylinositol alpha-1,6-mannosyltransferase